MKIHFTVPPSRDGKRPPIVVPPLGLLYLAASVVRAGHEAVFHDAQAEGLSWTEFERRVKNSDADLFALSAMTPTWDVTKRAIELIKSGGGRVVVGGPHITMRGPSFYKREKDVEVDFAVAGEAEKTLVELLDTLDGGGDPERISGVIGRTGTLECRAPVSDIDRLPAPARELLNNDLYTYPLLGEGRATTLFTSRGCPHGCVFCDKSVFGSKPRLHSPDRVLEEIRRVVCHDGVKSVIIYDDLFTVDRERVIEICRRIIEEGPRFRWKCEGRIDNVDGQMLQLMARAGCRIVAYGIETVHDKGLRFINKGASARDAALALSMTRAAGMDTVGYFLVGIPGERIEDVRETARFAARWGVTWAQFSVLSPIEGTRLHDIAAERGWLGASDALNPFDADLDRPAVLDGYWTPERLREALRAAHREFYLRPSYVWKRFARAGGLREMANLARRGLGFAGWMIRNGK